MHPTRTRECNRWRNPMPMTTTTTTWQWDVKNGAKVSVSTQYQAREGEEEEGTASQPEGRGFDVWSLPVDRLSRAYGAALSNGFGFKMCVRSFFPFEWVWRSAHVWIVFFNCGKCNMSELVIVLQLFKPVDFYCGRRCLIQKRFIW